MPEPKDYARRFVKGSSIVFVALVVAGFIGILMRMFLLRELSVFDYGLFYAAFTFISFITLFRTVGLNDALAKYTPEFMLNKQYGEIRSSMAVLMLIQVLLTLPITLIFVFLSDPIATVVCGTAAAGPIFKILGLWFFVMLFFHIFRSAFQGFQDQVTYASMEIAYILVTFLCVFFATRVFYLGVEGVAFGFLVGVAILVILWLAIFKKKYPHILMEKIRVKKPLIKKITFFALPVFIGGIGSIVLSYTDTIMLSMMRGPGDVALYQAAQPLAYLLTYFPAALGVVLLPITSELWAKREKKLLGQALYFIMKFSFIIIIPAVFIFMAFPATVMRSFAGPDYLPAVLTLQILTLAVIAGTLIAILHCVAGGIGKPIIATKVIGVMAVLNFIGNFLIIPVYGTAGAAATTLISGVVGLFLTLYLMRKFVKFALPTSSLFKTIIAGLLALLFILGLKSIITLTPWWLEFVIIAIPGLLFYVAIILAMQTIDKRDLKLLKATLPIPKRLVKIVEKFVRK